MACNSTPQKSSIIIWEYETDIPGCFAPYRSDVSNFIEEKFQAGKSIVHLNHVNAILEYSVCTRNPMVQESVSTGEIRKVKRCLYPSDCLPGHHTIWEWFSVLGWTEIHVDLSKLRCFIQIKVYNLEVASKIEKAYLAGEKEFDLEKTSIGIPNVIYFKRACQVNKISNFTRQIQRRTLLIPYMSKDGHSASVDPVLRKHCTVCRIPPDEECSICLESLKQASSYKANTSTFSQLLILSDCSHIFHEECLQVFVKASKLNHGFQCPLCKKIYGVKFGDQPPGTMTTRTAHQSLDGHPNCGTIIIQYDFQQGLQGPEHPNPGKPYNLIGFPRTAYLPNNTEGQKVLKLLRKAWERRLTFTIAQSVTTMIPDSVVWNEIHHKTERYGNYSGHGFPDPNYLDNVTEELKAHGVVESDSDDEPIHSIGLSNIIDV